MTNSHPWIMSQARHILLYAAFHNLLEYQASPKLLHIVNSMRQMTRLKTVIVHPGHHIQCFKFDIKTCLPYF